MEQYKNLNRIMEARDHFKNGESLKILKSKRNFVKKFTLNR